MNSKRNIFVSLLFTSVVGANILSSSIKWNDIVLNRPESKGLLINSIYDTDKKPTFYETYFKDEFPIFGFVSMPKANALGNSGPGINPSFLLHDVYQLYKDAGFNVVCPTYQREFAESIDVHREIEICQDLDLKYLIRDTDFLCNSSDTDVTPEYCEEKFNNEKQWYLNHPNVIGIQTKDEPSIKDFDVMGNFYKSLYQHDKTKWAFTTLFPPGANAKQLQVEDLVETMSLWDAYKLYVRQYVEKTNTAYILYDQYLNISRFNPLSAATTNSFLRTLSYYSNLAREFDITLMTAIASYRHGAKFEMSPEEIKWCSNIQLAYGSKGIEYYTYWPTIGGAQTMNGWKNTSRMGLVTSNGIPHDTYYVVQENNRNIRAVEKYLIKSKFKGIKSYGLKLNIEPIDLVSDPNDFISNISGDAFVGVFDNEGKKVYYIVNNSWTSGYKNFIVKFNGKHRVRQVNINTNKITDNAYSVGFTLSSGEAMLLEVE